MSSRYDKPVRALNVAELHLRGACRSVEKDLPPEFGGPRDSDSVGSQDISVGGNEVHAPTPENLVQREFSGRRDPPELRPRRRLLSTICPHCKDRERELGYEESVAQVCGRCEHGVPDEISTLEDPDAEPEVHTHIQ